MSGSEFLRIEFLEIYAASKQTILLNKNLLQRRRELFDDLYSNVA
jgi:hypothetical protein